MWSGQGLQPRWVGLQHTAQWLYLTVIITQDHSVDVFWLTHYQSSQQETISKFLLMQPPSIYIPGEQEMATDSFSGHSGSTLLA